METFNHLIKYEALNLFSMRHITVRSLRQIPLEQQRLEVVERKGLGHPDYICDAIMDQISVKLSKGYIDRFGTIMHHNVDKSLY